MAGMKLLDREIVDSDETHAERHEILGAVGREIRVVAAEIALTPNPIGALTMTATGFPDCVAPCVGDSK